MIEIKIPYNSNGDLGDAYNNAVRSSNKDWVLMLDHDVMIMHPNWFHLCEMAIKNNPSAGIFTCWTNKIGSNTQKDLNPLTTKDSLFYHRIRAKEFWERFGYDCTKLSEPTKKFSGFFLLVSREAFRVCGGAKSGFFGVDWNLKDRICNAGYDAFRIDGLYAFHLRDREPSWIEGQKTSISFNP